MAVNQEQFKKRVQIAIAAAVAIAIAPFIFLLIGGIVGIAVAFVTGSILLACMPAFSERMTQLKFSTLKSVISRAPVETLYGRAQEQDRELNTQREILSRQAASLELYKKKAVKFNADYPEDAPAINEQLVGYEKLFAFRIDAFKVAKSEHAKFLKIVEKAEAIYEMAMADAALGNSFNKNKDFMAMFREKTAFDAIDKANSASMANLRMALVDDEYVNKQVSNAPMRVINYDNNNQVLLGDILKAEKIPLTAFRQSTAQ